MKFFLVLKGTEGIFRKPNFSTQQAETFHVNIQLISTFP